MAENRSWQLGFSSDEGPVKEQNEDDYIIRTEVDSSGEGFGLLAIADGMGGYARGDEASEKAVTLLGKYWEKKLKKYIMRDMTFEFLTGKMTELFQEINAELGKIDGKAGTTLSVLFLYRGHYMITHIGDSRIYKISGASFGFDEFVKQRMNSAEAFLDEQQTEELYTEFNMTQLTPDHSWVETQVRKGVMTREEARRHRKRNVLTQCLGVAGSITPYIHTGEYKPDDIFLLCSDGFHSMFSEKEISESIQGIGEESDNFQSIADYLVNLSNFSGTRDNITVMLARNFFESKRPENGTANPFISLLKRWGGAYG